MSPTPSPTAADEDAWQVPSAWSRNVEPFRGRGQVRVFPADPQAAGDAQEVRRAAETDVRAACDDPRSEVALVDALRRHEGRPTGLLRRVRAEPDPLGAALVAAVLVSGLYLDDRRSATGIADAWVLEHGVVFAAQAAALLPSVLPIDPRYTALDAFKRSSTPVLTRRDPACLPGTLDEHLLLRTRRLLAGLDDDTHRPVVEALAALRARCGVGVRVATSVLCPDQREWVEADAEQLARSTSSPEPMGRALLLLSATTAQQAEAALRHANLWELHARAAPLATAAAHVGPALAPFLRDRLDEASEAAGRKRIAGLLAHLPTDEALGALLDRVETPHLLPGVLEALNRFPRRGARLLAERATGPGTAARRAAALLRDHLVAHPELDATALPVERPARPEEADADAVPPLLVRPPWQDRAREKPVVVPGLERDLPLRLTWEPGEREAWAQEPVTLYWQRGPSYEPSEGDWKSRMNDIRQGQRWHALEVLALGPEHLVRELFDTDLSQYYWDALPPLRRVLARFGEEALPLVLRAARASLKDRGSLLLPVDGSEVAHLMSDKLGGKTTGRVAADWLVRHQETAAVALAARALGKPGKPRTTAEAALRLVAERAGAERVRAAVAALGPEAAAGLDAVLGADPLTVLPARMPSLPAWVDPAHLPAPVLPGGGGALPVEAVENLLRMLALGRPGEPYAGVAVVAEALDRASLARCAWALFERWGDAGFPSTEGWVLHALGAVGDDDVARDLAPLVRVWPQEGAAARAQAGLDVLAAIGSDLALMHLSRLADKAPSPSLRRRAGEKMAEVCAATGLSPEQLADRLVPTLGLDAGGTLLLEYGPRRFRVGFDAALRPVLSDEGGARRASLPKPSTKDDPELAAQAQARWTALKKDAKVVAGDLVRRLERAMVTGRTWTTGEFTSLLVEHPLVGHVTRRLVWLAVDGAGVRLHAFRVAEDMTLADVDDEALVLPEGVQVAVAHPLQLAPDEREAWAQLLADYEVLQPFPQLERDVHALTEQEQADTELRRQSGPVSTGRVLALLSRGWERGDVMDGGVAGEVSLSLPGGTAVLALEPGLVLGAPMEYPEQQVRVLLEGAASFGALTPVAASELLRDLAGLTA